MNVGKRVTNHTGTLSISRGECRSERVGCPDRVGDTERPPGPTAYSGCQPAGLRARRIAEPGDDAAWQAAHAHNVAPAPTARSQRPRRGPRAMEPAEAGVVRALLPERPGAVAL